MATLQRGKTYWIAYRNGQGEASERVIHMREVSPGAYGKSYIRAFCELAGEERTFRLDRITDVELLEGPLSDTTPVTQRRNSSYLGPNSEPAQAAIAAPAAPAPTATAPAREAPARVATAPAQEKNHGFRRFLLKAAAIFILFDFVITEDPGSMSVRFVDVVESAVDAYAGGPLPSRVTSLWVYNEAEPKPEPILPPQPEPTPDPIHVHVPSPKPAENLAVTFNVSASRVREVARPEPPSRTPEEIRRERLERKAEVTDELVISRYRRADLNGDGELSWYELKTFQRKVYRDFSYESNDRALRPEEFFVAGGGDCEDFAIFSAAMLTYWGWDAYVASMETNADNAHAVVFIKVDRAPSWASYYEIPLGTGNPRFAASGVFVPVDYDVVGGVSTAVTPGSRVTDIVVVNAWYGLPI